MSTLGDWLLILWSYFPPKIKNQQRHKTLLSNSSLSGLKSEEACKNFVNSVGTVRLTDPNKDFILNWFKMLSGSSSWFSISHVLIYSISFVLVSASSKNGVPKLLFRLLDSCTCFQGKDSNKWKSVMQYEWLESFAWFSKLSRISHWRMEQLCFPGLLHLDRSYMFFCFAYLRQKDSWLGTWQQKAHRETLRVLGRFGSFEILEPFS